MCLATSHQKIPVGVFRNPAMEPTEGTIQRMIYRFGIKNLSLLIGEEIKDIKQEENRRGPI